jgi:hypothetical protein
VLRLRQGNIAYTLLWAGYSYIPNELRIALILISENPPFNAILPI